MPPASNRLVISLLAQFANLQAGEQAAFLDTLNVYLYTSPQQRRALRQAWADGRNTGLAGIPGNPVRGSASIRKR